MTTTEAILFIVMANLVLLLIAIPVFLWIRRKHPGQMRTFIYFCVGILIGLNIPRIIKVLFGIDMPMWQRNPLPGRPGPAKPIRGCELQ